MGKVMWDSKKCGAGLSLSNNNLTVNTVGSTSVIMATGAVSSGKWYWEIKFAEVGAQNLCIGICTADKPLYSSLGHENKGFGYRCYDGMIWGLDEIRNNYGSCYTKGDVIGIALDLDNNNGQITFYKNGVSQGVAVTNIKTKLNTNTIYPAISDGTTGAITTVNFGATPFTYSMPSEHSSYESSQYKTKYLLHDRNDIFGTCDSMMFAGKYTENIIPVMTSNDCNNIEITVSQTYNQYDDYQPYHSFDRNINSENKCWTTSNNTPCWLKINFKSNPKRIAKYTIIGGNALYKASPNTWTLEGSIDGATWVILDRRNDEVFNSNFEKKVYTFDNDDKYQYYKLNITKNNGYGFHSIVEMEFMEKIYTKKIDKITATYPPTENDFLDSGIDDFSPLYQRGDLKVQPTINNREQISTGKIYNFHVKKSDMWRIDSFEVVDA